MTAPTTATTTNAVTTTAVDATTTVVQPDPALALRPERRRSVRGIAREDVFALVGSLAASLALDAIVYIWLTPFNGVVGFFVCWYLLFLLCYVVAVAQDHGAPGIRDRLSGAIVHGLAVLLFLTLGDIVVYVFVKGAPALHHWNFFTQDMSRTNTLAPLTSGGIKHALLGTFFEISMALLFTVPVGVLTAVFLNEIPGRLARLVRTVAEAATALPSIIAGLFIYAVFEEPFGHASAGLLGKSAFAASLALSLMMLPIIIRASDVVLRLVSGSLKEASYALGAGQWRTVWQVTLPTARSGLTTAVILGSARGIGETSPVLLTAGYTLATNTDPLHNPMASLPLAVFKFVTLPEQTMIDRGYGTAAVLMTLVFILFGAARLAARQRRSLRP